MDITVKAIPSGMSMLLAILSLVMVGIGIYLIFLFIRALRVYIKKNA